MSHSGDSMTREGVAASVQGRRIPDGQWFAYPRQAGDYGAVELANGERRWFNRPPNAEPGDPDCVLNEKHVVLEHGDGSITVHASILNHIIDSADIGGHGPISTRGTRPWHGHLEHGTWRSVLLVIADALDPSGFADESLAVSRTDTRYSEAAPDDTRTGLSWTCPHGVTYSGSMDFCSGARNAHDEYVAREAHRG